MLKQFLKRIWDGGSDPSDSELYELVAIELAEGSMDIGLWTKSCAISGGATDEAKATYIQMRVSQLRTARGEIAKAISHEQRALYDDALKSREAEAQEAARIRSIEAHNSPINAAIAEIDVRRRPLLAELYGAKTDSQRRKAAAKLLPLDTRRAELMRSLRS